MSRHISRYIVTVSITGALMFLALVPHARAQSVVTVTTEDTANGSVLATGSGMTLYALSADEATPGKSACTGNCLNAWPPLLATSAGTVQAGGGVDPSKLGTISIT